MEFNIRNRIYEIIKEKRQKQSAVAISAGYDPKLFNSMLRGRKKIDGADIPKICQGLGVTPNELFNYENKAS